MSLRKNANDASAYGGGDAPLRRDTGAAVAGYERGRGTKRSGVEWLRARRLFPRHSCHGIPPDAILAEANRIQRKCSRIYTRVYGMCVRAGVYVYVPALASAVAALFEPFCPIPLAAQHRVAMEIRGRANARNCGGRGSPSRRWASGQFDSILAFAPGVLTGSESGCWMLWHSERTPEIAPRYVCPEGISEQRPGVRLFPFVGITLSSPLTRRPRCTAQLESL